MREAQATIAELTKSNEELLERLQVLRGQMPTAAPVPPPRPMPVPAPSVGQSAPPPIPLPPPTQAPTPAPSVPPRPEPPFESWAARRLSETAMARMMGDLIGFRDQLVDGQVGLRAPESMRVGESANVLLMISMAKAAQELRQALETTAGAEGVRALQAAKLSRYMSARLDGLDFDIAGSSSPNQLVDLDEDVQWQWNVRPKKAGKLALTVTLTAVLRVDGSDKTKDVETLSKEIVVEAVPEPPPTMKEIAAGLWRDYQPPASFLWGTVFMALVTRVWHWRKTVNAKSDGREAALRDKVTGYDPM